MIQSMLADMAISLEATRLLVMQAAWIGDQGKRNTFEASLSKAYGGPAGVMAALDAVQVIYYIIVYRRITTKLSSIRPYSIFELLSAAYHHQGI